MIWGIFGLIQRQIGRSVHEWSEFAIANPGQAALELELAAHVLYERATSFRRQHGLRARRHYAYARALLKQAADLRNRAASAPHDDDGTAVPWRPQP